MTLNEADVPGLRLEPSGAWCDLLLHVVALPESGPMDPDARRTVDVYAPGGPGLLWPAWMLRVMPADSKSEVHFAHHLPAAVSEAHSARQRRDGRA
jgi:hypothetical protein